MRKTNKQKKTVLVPGLSNKRGNFHTSKERLASAPPKKCTQKTRFNVVTGSLDARDARLALWLRVAPLASPAIEKLSSAERSDSRRGREASEQPYFTDWLLVTHDTHTLTHTHRQTET